MHYTSREIECKGVSVQASIDACPVDCIHWVDKEQLPALEHVMQKRMGRTNVGVMMAGQGVSNGDVFALTNRFLKEREARCAGFASNGLMRVHQVLRLGLMAVYGTCSQEKTLPYVATMCSRRQRSNRSNMATASIPTNSYRK